MADELNPELAQKNSERLKQTVNVVQDRIQRRADKERRIWIDQKTFIAKEKFNFDKYDQNVARILIRSQPKFIRQKFMVKSHEEIHEKKEKDNRKKTALEYAKRELEKREKELNPGGKRQIERHCRLHSCSRDSLSEEASYYMRPRPRHSTHRGRLSVSTSGVIF